MLNKGIVAAVLLTLSFTVLAKQTVVVYVSHIPPFNILYGEEKGKGQVDIAISQVEAELSAHYQFQFREAPFSRFFADAMGGKHICHFTLRRTAEREAYLDYTSAHTFSIGNGLIVSQSKLSELSAFINQQGEIDLAAAIEQGGLKMFVERDRIYSPLIGQVLQQAQTSKGTVTTYSKSTQLESKVKMLRRRNLMGLIGYPSEVFYQNKGKSEEERIAYLPVAESLYATSGHLACTKGEWNREFMRAAEASLDKIRRSPEYYQLQYQWLPANLHSNYLSLVKERLDLAD